MNAMLDSITLGITAMIRVDHSHVLALLRRYKPDVSRNRKKALAVGAALVPRDRKAGNRLRLRH